MSKASNYLSPGGKGDRVWLNGDSKLAIGLNVSVKGWLSPCLSPTDWQPVQGVPLAPYNPELAKWKKMDGRMNEY